jgi:hypoxanthine-DNA glycosylase
MLTHVVHPFEPVYNQQSRVLILGSLPSPKSREFGFYYGHPQNIFWATLAKVLQVSEPEATKAARTQFLMQHHIALYDVIVAADIKGAQDATIQNPTPADLTPIFQTADITHIFVEGRKAQQLYQTYLEPVTQRDVIYLPSTSPANRFTQKQPSYWQHWQQVADALQKKHV